ncbi:MAG TPA: T9SS type B sorting domain-containing protein [Flavobacterium sp.]|jgi:gliding motility-associated-like protein
MAERYLLKPLNSIKLFLRATTMRMILALCCVSTSAVFSQQEASVWYFGRNAGLKFNTDGSVTPLSDGQLNTTEGCSSIADANGNLLFYTDGRTVWDRNHVIMPEGNYFAGTGLFGDPSSTQSAVIVPKPGNPDVYYIFTVDEPHHENAAVYPNAFSGMYLTPGEGSTPSADDGLNNGLNFSVVDLSITGSNGSIGDVVSRNNHLVTYDTNPAGEQIKYKCSEKITAVKNQLANEYWVVTHFIDRFYSFKINESGVAGTPVVSVTGPSINTAGYRRNSIGYMKTSPDGQKIAVAHQQNGSIAGMSAPNTGQILLYDFNTTTGAVSNENELLHGVHGYGVEFSAQSQKLYTTFVDGLTGIMSLVQFDLLAANIPASIAIIDNNAFALYALQLAPNNKIYLAIPNASAIGVINNPEEDGTACNYQPTGQPLSPGKQATLGLPPFITSFFNASFSIENLCMGAETEFSLTASQQVTGASWDFGDGFSATGMNPVHEYTSAGQFLVTATITTAAGTTVRSNTITISETPTANPVAAQAVCGTANMAFDLTQFNATILGLQSATTFIVSYHLTQADADNHTNSLPAFYPLPLGTTTFFVNVRNAANLLCFDTENFTLTLSAKPTANPCSDFTICESTPYDGIGQFDLSLKNNEILGSQDASAFNISYHLSQAEADNGSNALSLSFTNTSPSQVIYYRIENNAAQQCFETGSFSLLVVPQAVISNVSDFIICDDASNNGIESFDLSLKAAEILAGQTGFDVSFYLTQADAENNANEIVAPLSNSVNNQTIYYTISVPGNNACAVTGTFNLVVAGYVPFADPQDLYQCDDVSNDGIALFNLEENNDIITGLQQVSYHASPEDAQNNTAPLPGLYQNISNPQTIYVRIQTFGSSCFSTASFDLTVHRLPVANLPAAVHACDADNDSHEIFDLDSLIPAVLGNQSSAEYTVTFHASVEDAENGVSPLASDYTNTTNPQTIFIRVSNNANTSCASVTTVELILHEQPDAQLEETYSICEGVPVTINAAPGYSSYLWSNGDVGLQATYFQPGNHSLTITNNNNGFICETETDFVIYGSGPATITYIETADWTVDDNSITINVTGAGDYEFSLDGMTYQDDNHFYNLSAGEYTVYVQDKHGCGITTGDFYLLMYPKFFTPNGDGFNDVWKIKLSQLEPEIQITIFDRYGKLLTSFRGSDAGWDGTYNAAMLPSTDYWFVVKRRNGQEHRGHFSMKR